MSGVAVASGGGVIRLAAAHALYGAPLGPHRD
jgi:hypothetical protein